MAHYDYNTSDPADSGKSDDKFGAGPIPYHGPMKPRVPGPMLKDLIQSANRAPGPAVQKSLDNPKDLVGSTKPGVSSIPPSAMIYLGQAMANGAAKYGAMNYRETPVRASVYYDAMMRHLFQWWDGEDIASDSKVHHLAHVMANCAILLDTALQGTQKDDRPIKGKVSELIAYLTRTHTLERKISE
jgi:hypothetical protein